MGNLLYFHLKRFSLKIERNIFFLEFAQLSNLTGTPQPEDNSIDGIINCSQYFILNHLIRKFQRKYFKGVENFSANFLEMFFVENWEFRTKQNFFS